MTMTLSIYRLIMSDRARGTGMVPLLAADGRHAPTFRRLKR